jgi:hypothetical protein
VLPLYHRPPAKLVLVYGMCPGGRPLQAQLQDSRGVAAPAAATTPTIPHATHTHGSQAQAGTSSAAGQWNSGSTSCCNHTNHTTGHTHPWQPGTGRYELSSRAMEQWQHQLLQPHQPYNRLHDTSWSGTHRQVQYQQHGHDTEAAPAAGATTATPKALRLIKWCRAAAGASIVQPSCC